MAEEWMYRVRPGMRLRVVSEDKHWGCPPVPGMPVGTIVIVAPMTRNRQYPTGVASGAIYLERPHRFYQNRSYPYGYSPSRFEEVLTCGRREHQPGHTNSLSTPVSLEDTGDQAGSQ